MEVSFWVSCRNVGLTARLPHLSWRFMAGDSTMHKNGSKETVMNQSKYNWADRRLMGDCRAKCRECIMITFLNAALWFRQRFFGTIIFRLQLIIFGFFFFTEPNNFSWRKRISSQIFIWNVAHGAAYHYLVSMSTHDINEPE